MPAICATNADGIAELQFLFVADVGSERCLIARVAILFCSKLEKKPMCIIDSSWWCISPL